MEDVVRIINGRYPARGGGGAGRVFSGVDLRPGPAGRLCRQGARLLGLPQLQTQFQDQPLLSLELRKTLREKTAGDVMITDLVIVGESTGIEEAIRLMVDKRLKRLPVVDAEEGRFRGMISRDALLKTA